MIKLSFNIMIGRESKASKTLTTAGVQTGRTSKRNSSSSIQVDFTKRESQLSFNLSDLSDEEVDRRITRLTIEIENEVYRLEIFIL